MLTQLHVRDLALVKEATLELGPGLTAITGETGAGKTALLSALRLITGQRGDSKAVRDGAPEALVEARFEAAPDADAAAAEGEGAEERFASRKINAQGRSRCSLNGEMATVAQLAQAMGFVHMHNQHDQVQLLQPAEQLRFLDAYIDPAGNHMAEYRAALAAFRDAAKRCKELEDAAGKQEQELEYCRFVDSQISQVNPQKGEYEQLEEELPRLQHAEQLAQATRAALTALNADGGALDGAAQASAALRRQEGVDSQLDSIAATLDECQTALSDAAATLRDYADGLSYDPTAVQSRLSRLSALDGLMKRYGPTMEQVLGTWGHAKAALEGNGASPQQIEQAREERDTAMEELKAQGVALQEKRRQAAQELCDELAASVAELAMPTACFEFEFHYLNGARWTDAGPATAELLYRPAPSVTARPLRQIASGGELSRILLALECVLRDKGGSAAGDTLVFDEVDAGIGGATGEAVGKRLLALAQHVQVIVVTHLPQVACLANTQLCVEKSMVDGMPCTDVVHVEGEERVAELARMLAGTDDATALQHARELLKATGK